MWETGGKWEISRGLWENVNTCGKTLKQAVGNGKGESKLVRSE